ncbi:MAG: hypothetical protein FWF49_01210 [Oscillospiraceae bacterium]|nr:hypothetical protein [Oscillospiraceae bacterium]
MKRILILALSAAFVCALAGCTSTTPSSSDSTTAATTTTTTVTTATTADTPLTDEQLNNVLTFLNDPENNGFVTTTYDRVQDINLYWALYELKTGAGGTALDINTPSAELGAVEAVAGSLATTNKVIKYPHAQLDAFLMQKIGIPSADAMSNSLWTSTNAFGLIYLEAYDAYYLVGGDDYTGMQIGARTGNSVTPDGVYEVSITFGNPSEISGVVTMQKTADGYQFISNVKNQ